MKKITVYCASSSGSEKIYKNQAFKLGQTLALNDFELVYGGAKVGLMGAVADGALSEGGKVIGVLPKFLDEKELQHTSLSKIYLVDTMHERKAQMCNLGDGFIALPGGFGTMEELFEMLTWSQLSLHQKPIAILNVDGYYDSLIAFIETMLDKGFLKEEYRDLLIISDDIEILLEKMKKFEPLKNDKWFIVK